LEVDNALVELSTLREELDANNIVMTAASNASYLSRQRYYQGVTSYLEVIENQRVEFDAKLSLAENYQKLLNAYVNLYKSLGGGWISQEEMDIYARQVADDQNMGVSEIEQDTLGYNGQIVDLNLTKEQEKARKEAAKALRKQEKEARKAQRRNQ
ncbi:MAG: hypothetical protein OEM04_11205, partial [Flavobacteriaceae bacterium]|nr:hypothetical protein [Flavobacteriaceae bacterium]